MTTPPAAVIQQETCDGQAHSSIGHKFPLSGTAAYKHHLVLLSAFASPSQDSMLNDNSPASVIQQETCDGQAHISIRHKFQLSGMAAYKHHRVLVCTHASPSQASMLNDNSPAAVIQPETCDGQAQISIRHKFLLSVMAA